VSQRITRTHRNGRPLGAVSIAATLAVAAGLGASPVGAQTTTVAVPQTVCKPWREVVSELGDRYAERPVAYGTQPNGHLLQVFVSEQTGTWTLVTMRPNGTACLIGAGQGWEAVPKPNADPAA
jgi:hypothetical protein